MSKNVHYVPLRTHMCKLLFTFLQYTSDAEDKVVE